MGPDDLVVVGRCIPSSFKAPTTLKVPTTLIALTHSPEQPEEESSCTIKLPNHGCVEQRPRAGWWKDANISGVKGLESATEPATLLDARVIKGKTSQEAKPWAPGASQELYTEMGMVDPSKGYLAVWLNLGAASLLFVLELADSKSMDVCLEDNFLTHRLKFISNPVQMRGALPSKSLEDADAVGKFFGKQNTSCALSMTDKGVAYTCIQVDVFSKWYVRIAFQQVALRLGNVLELALVDQPSLSVFAGCRLIMTQELLDLLSA